MSLIVTGTHKEVKGPFILLTVQADVSTLLSALSVGAARWLVSILIHFLYNWPPHLPHPPPPPCLSHYPQQDSLLHDLYLPFQPCGQYLWTALLHYWMGGRLQSSQGAHRSSVCPLICWTACFRETAARGLFLYFFQGFKLTSLCLDCYLPVRCLMLLTSGQKVYCTRWHFNRFAWAGLLKK